jgi:hypothetical protein
MQADTKVIATEIIAEVELELGRAARRAWRQLVPDWRDREAELVLVFAVAAVSRRRPELSDATVLAELQRLGIVAEGGAVRVPELPGEVPVPFSGSRQ